MAGYTREYDVYAPTIVEYIGLDAEDPRRHVLRRELVVGFLPVARHIARRFARGGEPADDLEQVAVIGLLRCLERFDPGRGGDFLSYAVPSMMGEVRRHFRDGTWTIRTPRGVKDRYLAVGTATTAMAQELGRAPTPGELAVRLGLTRDEVAEALAAEHSLRPSSLDETLTSGDPTSVADLLGAEDPDFERVELQATLRDLVGRLPERERTMLALRFLHEKTQAEIATVLCISQMHVSRLLAKTLTQLREELQRTTDVADLRRRQAA